MTSPVELSVVVPVYDEEDSIEQVVREWSAELHRLGIDFEILLYDDGSHDGTAAAMRHLAAGNARVIAQSHANRGHGPTIVRGYNESRGAWVFQTDSDGEMSPAGFAALWKQRQSHDLLIGTRAGRRLSPLRFLLTMGSRSIVRLAFGRGVRDVNSPYRLMRGSWLRQKVLPYIPAGTAIPNIAISGIAARSGARVLEMNVPYVPRRAGRSSVNVKRAARLAWSGAIQTLRIMRAVPR